MEKKIELKFIKLYDSSDSYSLSRSSHHDHDHGDDEFQRSLSQEYGVPQAGSFRNTPSTEYGPPSAKSSLNYLPSSGRVSQEYGLPSRSLSQEYGAPKSRSNLKLSQDYGLPNARANSKPSQVYGAPNARGSPSLEYGPPQDFSGANVDSYAVEHAPSSQYGTPEVRTPSENYGVPQRNHDHRSQKQARNQALSRKYGVPSGRSNDVSQSYGAPKNSFKSFAARNSPSQSYGAPKSGQFDAPSTSYGVPSASQGFKSLSSTYGTPSQRGLSETYGTPSARGLSQEYGAPTDSELKTKAIASTYASGRTSPSHAYGVPSARDSMPSDQYGIPEQYSALNDQSYEYARAALEELNQVTAIPYMDLDTILYPGIVQSSFFQEPANYDFAYKVNDYVSGSDFGHAESRQENRAEGTYFVVLPDGTKQVVEYEADERGFKPRISVEPVETDLGYDDNASDLTKSENGPY
uniref:Putative cuticle protein n=1 Tax=Bombyx mori TaxID=7091 RepID=C0H6Y7_BOMMO|nr:TPA: putative cuticle protein [Bombyx mori]